MTTSPDQPVMIADHGYVPYTKGCRCQVCRQAKADYMRARRAEGRRRAQSLGPGRNVAYYVTHGTRYAYEEHGCRCSPCLAARASSDHATYRARRVASVGGAA